MRRGALLGWTSAALLALPGAAIAGQSTTFQIDAAHSGHLPDPLGLPVARAWEKPIGQPSSSDPGLASYPLIADGKVFVTARTSDAYGTELLALDQATGSTVWSRAIGGTYYWSNAAYEAGRIFHVNYDGLMQAFAADTGAALWSIRLPGQYSFSSPPTAAGGIVYTGGAGSGGTLYAVRADNGDVLWTRSVANGDHSSPAVDDRRVYVSYACPQVYAFDRITGEPIWHHNPGCSGGGGRTPAVHNGRLYVRSECCTVFDATTGQIVDSFAAGPPPAFAGNVGVFLHGGTLRALDLSTGTTVWNFAGDGTLSSTPVIVGGHVYVGGTSGNLYAVSLTTGAVAWADNVGAPVPTPDEHNVSVPTTGLGAGEGMLVVPALGKLVAYSLARQEPAPQQPAPQQPVTQQPVTEGGEAPPAARVTLRIGPRRVAVGEAVRLRGRVVGAGSGVRVELQADRFPFDGAFARVKGTNTLAEGRFRMRTRPRRNTRYRVVTAAGPPGASRAITVWADYPARLDIVASRTRRSLFIGLAIDPPRGVRLLGRRIGFYRARRGARTLRLVRAKPVRRLRRGLVGNYAIAKGARRYSPRDWVMVCIREERDDGYGRWGELDRRCGERSFRIRRGRVLGLSL